MVIDTSKKYLPGLAKGFDDPKVKVFVGDGYAYMKSKPGEFDVIIVDSSDPVGKELNCTSRSLIFLLGPAETLYQREFYEYMKLALKPEGIVCTQAECQWLHLPIIKNLLDLSKDIYKHAEYAYTTIPTYPCGQIGFLLGSLGDSCKVPKRKLDPEAFNLRYYNPELHQASFILPQFAKKALNL